MWKNLKISIKIAIAFAVPVILIMFMSVYHAVLSNDVEQVINRAKNERFVFALVALQMDKDVVQIQQWLSDISATRAYEGFDDGFDEAEKHYQSFLIGLQRFKTMFQEEGNVDKVNDMTLLKEKVDNYYAVGKKMAQAYIDGGPESGNETMGTFDEQAEALATALEPFVKEQIQEADSMLSTVINDINSLSSVFLMIAFVILILAVLFGFIIIRSVGGPLKYITTAISEIMKSGDFSKQIELDQKDETGQLGAGFNRLLKILNSGFREINRVMGAVKNGDLTSQVKTEEESKLDTDSINEAIKMLSQAVTQVMIVTDQVNSGASEISNVSQSLASGTTEQAASLEEIGSTMSEVDSRAKASNDNANQAVQLTSQTMEIANQGNDQMKDMLAAMDRINKSSLDVSKIIKVIDEIAFQTNLLALNAAVEAARAGKYGKGFAVVADEVRTLAARSAEAAKNTTELIENSVKEVNSGVTNAGKTADVLKEIKEAVIKVNDLVSEIAAASLEQSNSTAEINTSLTQVNNVVQQNSSISEEAASASEELSGQAMELQALMNQFKVDQSERQQQSVSISQPEVKPVSHKEPERVTPAKMITLDDDSFGKY